jgi:hypothetical protein
MKALLIPVDGPARVTGLPSGGGTRFMNSIKTLIGTDCAERIAITTRWEAWLDENGTSAGRQVNQAATRLAQSFGWQLTLTGPVVIVGLDQNTDPAALSLGQIDAILGKTRTPAALHPACRSGSAPRAARWPTTRTPRNTGSPGRSRLPTAPLRNRLLPAENGGPTSENDAWNFNTLT